MAGLYGQTTQVKPAAKPPVKNNKTAGPARDVEKPGTTAAPAKKTATPAGKTVKPQTQAAAIKQMSPEDTRAKAFYDEGTKKAKAGDFNGAIAEFTKSLDQVKNAGTYVKRGYCFQMIADYTNAINDAEEALKLQPKISRAFFIRGVSHYHRGEYKEARADLNTFIGSEKDNAAAYNYLAAMCYSEQDFKGALANYDEVVKRDPKFPDIYTNRGMMRHTLQDYNGAIADYNEALKADPNNTKAYNNRGAAYMMLKDFKSALADFDKAISLNGKYADAFDNRGRAKHALGDTEGACADWQTAYDNGLEASKELIIQYCK